MEQVTFSGSIWKFLNKNVFRRTFKLLWPSWPACNCSHTNGSSVLSRAFQVLFAPRKTVLSSLTCQNDRVPTYTEHQPFHIIHSESKHVCGSSVSFTLSCRSNFVSHMLPGGFLEMSSLCGWGLWQLKSVIYPTDSLLTVAYDLCSQYFYLCWESGGWKKIITQQPWAGSAPSSYAVLTLK